MFRRKLLCLLLTCVLLIGILPIDFVAQEAYENIALGKTVTASSNYSDLYNCQKVTDGDDVSDVGRWNSKTTQAEEWIQVDLGKEYRVSQIVIKCWAVANVAKEMSVFVSTDGNQYTEVQKYTANNDLTNTVNLATPVNARYIKLVLNQCNSHWGYSLKEIEVYSPDVKKAENLALGKRVYVDENFNDNWTRDIEAYYVTDGDTSTRWSSAIYVNDPPAIPVESWLMIDLEQIVDLSEIMIRWNENVVYAKDYTILVSDNGLDFTEVMQVKTDTYIPIQKLILPENVSGRYVKLAFHVPVHIYGYSIQEVEVYGEKTGKAGTDLAPGEAEFALYTGSMKTIAHEKASGGYYTTGLDYRDTVTFPDVPESYGVKIRYMATFANAINLYVNGSLAATIDCPPTDRDTFGELSMPVYIQSGSDVKLVPTGTIDLDCVAWTDQTDIVYTENLLFAKDAKLTGCQVVDNANGSICGTIVNAGKNATLTFEEINGEAYNTIALKYIAAQDTAVTIQNGENKPVSFTLPASKDFHIVYLRLDDTIGKTVKITTGDAMTVDMLELVSAKQADTVQVELGDTARTTISLDGTWECTTGSYEDSKVPALFDKTIPVPGMWDLADYSLGDDTGKALWYQKTIHLEDELADGYRVVLHINKAYYGRTIFVNGRQVGKYWYNFTASDMDITDFLQKGDNRIQIKLGTFESGSADPNNPAHMGYDQEKSSYLPGLVDSVSLVISKDPYVDTVQTAPNLESGELRVKATLGNSTAKAITGDVILRIYELGVYTAGKPAMEKLIQTVTLENLTVDAKGTLVLDETVKIPDFTKAGKAWTPENPYLYRLEIETVGDVETYRFGMRTFEIDKQTGKSLLNGDVYYLRGTNVCINRFFEDSQRSDHPWDEEWVRQLFAEYKYVNWESARFCVGFPPEFWYDICDEIGFMVVDEYPYWFCNDQSPRDGCKADDLTEEVTTWIYERGNHPCVIFWDIQNESNTAYDIPLTAAVIQRVKNIDIQNRVWENGWGPVQDKYYPAEQHPYPFGFVPNFSLSDIGSNKIYFYNNNDTVANYINEYGWLWVDREGVPTLLTAGEYDDGDRGSNPEEYKIFYATGVAQMTERYRVSRKYFGILQFCGLSYSHPNGIGYTSDVLCPDLTTPIVREELKEKMRGAFASVGIVINDWSTSGKGGTTRSVPVIIVNDLNEDITKTVTVTLYKNHKEAELEKITSVTKTISAKAMEVTKATEFLLDMPADGGNYTIVASYDVEGENPICSTRYVVLSKGEGAVTPPETEEKPPVTEEELPSTNDPVVDDQPSKNNPTVPQSPTNEPAESGLWIGIAVAGLVVVAAVVVMIVYRRKK